MVSPHSAMLGGYRHCGSGDMNITVEITYREKGPSNTYKKYQCGHLGCWYIKSTLYKRFLN